MTARRARGGDRDRDRPLRLLPPRLVALSAEQERQAVDALARLLAGLLARGETAFGPTADTDAAWMVDWPDDPEAA